MSFTCLHFSCGFALIAYGMMQCIFNMKFDFIILHALHNFINPHTVQVRKVFPKQCLKMQEVEVYAMIKKRLMACNVESLAMVIEMS